MNPEITKHVHATYFDHFGVEKIRSSIEYLWGDGIIVVEGEKWAARQKSIKPSFDVVHIVNLENRSLASFSKASGFLEIWKKALLSVTAAPS
ncbi:hypothetical protein F4782DRAFT_497378 [Xylaria castorea]|nr:hypothetical protein F4782DRAFT_497378 [Xylaria castorea]